MRSVAANEHALCSRGLFDSYISKRISGASSSQRGRLGVRAPTEAGFPYLNVPGRRSLSADVGLSHTRERTLPVVEGDAA